MGLIGKIFFWLFAAIIILIVILVRIVRTPKRTMKKMENTGDLRGKTYSELCGLFGKPTSVSIESDGNKSAYWRKSNGFRSWHAAAKDTTIYAIFDRNGICLNYSYESNRNT